MSPVGACDLKGVAASLNRFSINCKSDAAVSFSDRPGEGPINPLNGRCPPELKSGLELMGDEAFVFGGSDFMYCCESLYSSAFISADISSKVAFNSKATIESSESKVFT